MIISANSQQNNYSKNYQRGNNYRPRYTGDRKSSRGEPFEVMLRRFFRDVQQSGLLTEIKRRKFRVRTLSRERIREAARRKAYRRKIKRGY